MPHRFLSTLSLRRATMWTVPGPPLFLIFLSTLSLRRATRWVRSRRRRSSDFYPRSPCGERRLELFLYYQDNRFLSTLSLRRATFGCWMVLNRLLRFLSTLSLRRATTNRIFRAKLSPISIHALLAESDLIRYRIKAR